jgi:protein TonB
MEANKILSADILDIIFDGRNKDYGAYELRKTYQRRLGIALLLTLAFALLLWLAIWLSGVFAEMNAKNAFKVKDIDLTEIKEEKKVEEVKPPPPPPKPEPPKIEVTKFTPPKIVKDEEVTPDEKPPEQDKLDDTKISDFNQEGEKSGDVVAPPVESKGTGEVAAPPVKDEDEDKIFTKVERDAEFPGGDNAWRRFLEKNLNPNVPVDNGAPEGTYTVVVKFVVDKEGKVSDITAESSHGYGMEEEAMKVLRKATQWKPAEQNGRIVKAYRRQPITFVVQGE